MHDVIAEMNMKTADGESFVLFNNKDDGIVVFGRPSHLDFLADSNCVLMDGTFKFCLRYFSQLYILVAEKNGWYIAVVSALLLDKMETTYNRLFRTLKQLVPNFPPKIMINFEKAVMNSIKTNFPNCAISCCHFHFGQAWLRKIQNLVLTELFRDRSSEEGS